MEAAQVIDPQRDGHAVLVMQLSRQAPADADVAVVIDDLAEQREGQGVLVDGHEVRTKRGAAVSNCKPRMIDQRAAAWSSRQCAPPASAGAADLLRLVIQMKAIRIRNRMDDIQNMSVAPSVPACTDMPRSMTAHAACSDMPCDISFSTACVKAGLCSPVCSASCAWCRMERSSHMVDMTEVPMPPHMMRTKFDRPAAAGMRSGDRPDRMIDVSGMKNIAI